WPVEDFFQPEPRTPGKMSSRWGGFLEAVDAFDPSFFGISPREAERMDPQQRLLLEVAWEALEDAGIPPRSLEGSATGVWIGIGASDYSRLLFEHADLGDAYSGTGGSLSIAANRISYFLDLRGPSLAVDSACSASLVAVEQACRSLRQGESDMALAGGVNLVLSPEVTVNFSQAGVLAADGRCKAFDARGDGYVRSEGAGVVVLKPLSRAQADGDPVYALILGGAVNQDGRSNGLTAPRPEAQERLLTLACRDAGVDPAAVQAIEAHGIGTPLADRIEAQALGAVLGARRKGGRPCSLGSVKTNLGHLEAASGIAGLIKMALCLHYRQLVPTLHYRQPSPGIDFASLGLAVQVETEAWGPGPGVRVAGVSAFGFGGTNAHLILGEAPPREVVAEPADRREELVVLSAQDPEALRQRAQDLLAASSDTLGAWGGDRDLLRDLSRTTLLHRSHLDHRLALVAENPPELEAGLAAMASGRPDQHLSKGERPFGGPGPLAFVFPGQGGQWPAMGWQLQATEPLFRRALEAAVDAIRPHVDWDPMAELRAPAECSRLREIDVVQPLLFSLQVALAALWRSWGVEPDAVIGHSLGEVAAATVAGALTLEDGARIICHRSQLLRMISGGGAMVAVDLDREVLEGLLEPFAGRVEIAVVDGPSSVVLSGEVSAVEELKALLERQDITVRPLDLDVAAHGPQIDALLRPLGQLLGGLEPRPPEIPLFSTVTGEAVEGADLDGSYWQRNLRRPVLWASAVENALEAGVSTFVEISPHPLLLESLRNLGRRTGRPLQVVSSLRRQEGERRQLLRSLGTLFCQGRELRWQSVAPASGRLLSLPSYPWQRRRYWLERGSVESPRSSRRGDSLEAYLRQALAKVLKAPPESFRTDVPLTALGLDSLVAAELRGALERDLGLEVPLAWLLRGDSLQDLKERLPETMPEPGGSSETPPQGSGPLEETEDLLDRIDRMPPEEVEKILAEMGALEVAR
ncbi:MAG: acyltransferase domain-containing protein, partial [Acidobacteria bacterium]|nr:acyltransferase domain-containing protein [Acidobacteriota bacterium]